MKVSILGFIIGIMLLSCSKKITSPSFIQFKRANDSLYVITKNTLDCPLYIKVINRKNQSFFNKQLEAKEEKVILSYSRNETDTLSILKTYQFKGYYGNLLTTEYDTLYNYSYPFINGYQSRIIQGYDGNFSHSGRFSSKTLDFDMKIGDTIVAARDGIVIKTVVKHKKQGTTEKYKDYGNYIMIYHDDNTFSQYVHLKQYGNLVNVGDKVKKDQPIALSGFTGYTTIPHLHFGVYITTENGLQSVPITLDSIPAKTLKRGDIVIKK